MNMITRILTSSSTIVDKRHKWCKNTFVLFVRVLCPPWYVCLFCGTGTRTNVLQMYKRVPLEKVAFIPYMMHVILPHVQRTLQFPNHWYYCLELICPTQMYRNRHEVPQLLGMVPPKNCLEPLKNTEPLNGVIFSQSTQNRTKMIFTTSLNRAKWFVVCFHVPNYSCTLRVSLFVKALVR
jgi:hypothetical protein